MKRSLSFRYRLLLFIVLPTVVVALYYMFLATDMYISETQFSLRSQEGKSSSELLALLGQGPGTTTGDAHVVVEYILSADMLSSLDRRLALRTHYQSPQADFVSRLASTASAEDFLDYYREVVEASFDTSSGILSVKVRAYTPAMARDLAQAILDESEQLVNRLREQALKDSLALAHSELDLAEQRVGKARDALKQLRYDTELLSPEATAGAVQNLVASLEAELARLRAQLAESRSYMREESAHVVALKARLAALGAQVAEEKSRLTGKDQRGLNEVLGDFEELTTEHEFAQKQYASALASLEAARIRGESKSVYLVAFAQPKLPEEALYPKRWLFSGLAFLVFSLLYGIASLVIAAIREHAGF